MALIIIELLWFMLPAYIANILPGGFKSKLKFLAIPVDFGKKFRGKRITGNHKTLRGFIVGSLGAAITGWFQQLLYNHSSFLHSISILDYNNVNAVLLGFLMGFGALFGDSLKSFFKRQRGIPPGERWLPFDQVDWVIGSLTFSSLIFVPGLKYILVALVMFPPLHISFNQIFYRLGARDAKW